MQLGFIGLGKMGSRMVEKLLREGHDVVVWNRSQDVLQEFYQVMIDKRLAQRLATASSIEDLVESLNSPKIIWSMLPAGDATEFVMQELLQKMGSNDIVIDGGNAFYKDTQRRFEEFRAKEIRFLGIGVSGGIIAEKEGYPLMVGGDKSAYKLVQPLLDSLAKPNGGYTYFGEGGAGHFVKMVHNGIEYGMMQAIGEGFGVLEKAPYNLDLLEVAKNWQKGTIVSSFLIDRARDALEKDPKLSDLQGVIAASGEGEWTVTQAKEEHVLIENIEQSLEFRRRSQTDEAIQRSFAAKMVAALRREFGGHAVKKKT